MFEFAEASRDIPSVLPIKNCIVRQLKVKRFLFPDKTIKNDDLKAWMNMPFGHGEWAGTIMDPNIKPNDRFMSMGRVFNGCFFPHPTPEDLEQIKTFDAYHREAGMVPVLRIKSAVNFYTHYTEHDFYLDKVTKYHIWDPVYKCWLPSNYQDLIRKQQCL